MERLVVTARDGASLVCWDFGGEGTPLFMVHGAGLHGRCWAPVAERLGAAGFRPLALDIRGHGASNRSPDGCYDWDLFALDVLETLEQLGLIEADRPRLAEGKGADGEGPAGVVAVGHSAGAAALLLAEASRPGTFSRIWAWEPIIAVPGRDDKARRGAELARRARQRRNDFASLDEAREHFQGRHMFAEFSPESLEAFVAGGLVRNDEGGYKLACDPEDEARVYEGAADVAAWAGLAHVQCPTRLAGGELSPAVPPDELAAIAAQLPARTTTVAEMSGLGHFGPFHDPGVAADDIANWAP